MLEFFFDTVTQFLLLFFYYYSAESAELFIQLHFSWNGTIALEHEA